MITEIALTNIVPNLYTSDECQMLVEAAAAALPAFCAEHGLVLPTVVFYPDPSKVPETSWDIPLLPAPAPGDANAGVEAYHELGANGVPDGKCFAGYLLAQAGGDKWAGELAVSVAWTHEMFEALLNPNTNLVITNPPVAPDGKTYATIWRECGDPAQGEHFEHTIRGTLIWTAGWTTRAWETPGAKGPYSMPLGLVPGWGRIGPKGYGGFGDSIGNVATIFAFDVHPAIKALKEMHGRLAEAAKLHAAAVAPPAPLPTTLFVDGVACPVAAVLGEKRAIVSIDGGIYLVVDQAQDGTWAETGNPPNETERAVLKQLVDATPDTLTVTKDPS
jgi:hypothetical protein